MSYKISSTLLLILSLLFWGCTQDVLEPEYFGTIEGQVISTQTSEGIQGVSIETTPATEALLTNGNGSFQLRNIPAGSYQVKAYKPDFKSKSVSIEVRENRTASAKILLEPVEEQTAASIEAEVTSWFQTGPTDSSDVNIEYKVFNSGSSAVNEFEVYFDIHTNQENFYYEVTGKQLAASEQNFGSFKKFVRDTAVDSVTISSVWIKEEEG